MKRKLFFLWAVLLSMICSSPMLADDIQDLRYAGWTQVTSLENVADNYYVLVDAASGNYTVGRGLAAGDRPMSHVLGNPFADNSQVWMLEGSGSTFKLKSLKDGYYLNSGNAGWNNSMNQTNGTDLTFTLNDGKYSINCATGYLGPWNNDNKVTLTDAAENIAVNKAANQAPGYYIFSMSRTEYESRVYNASKLEEQGWKKASDIASIAGDDYYVIFLESKGGSMTIAATESGRPAYKTLNDPLKSSYLLWTLVANGTTYALKNVASGTFFNAQDWNTGFGNTANAYRKFNALGDNKYVLQNTSNNDYVGRWQNQEAAPYEMENVAANKNEAQRGVYYVYYMTKSDYNAKRASAIATAANGASTSAPAELTDFISNPRFSDLNNYPWRESGGRGNAQFAANAAEYWNCNNLNFSQTITGLPNGKYRIEAQAVNPNNGSSPGAKIFANDATTDVTAQVAANNYGEVCALLMKDPELGVTTVETIINNNELTLGMKATTGWTIFDNFKMFYCGEDLSDYQPIFEAALNDAKAAASKSMASTYKNELTRVIGLYDVVFSSFSNVTAIVNAINDLQTATANAQPSIHSYEQGNAVNALIAAGETDVTAGIVNADCSALDDWSINNTSTFHLNTWSTEGNSDNTGMTTPFIENWVAKGSLLGDATIKHTLIDNLKAGYYQVQILARVYSEVGLEGAAISGATFNVNEKSIDLGSGEAFTYNNMEGVYSTYKAVVQVAANGSLDINFGINGANFNWLAFKNLKVAYLGTTVSAGTMVTNVKENEFVQSGQTVKIIMDNTTATYTLKAGSKVTVNGTACELTAIEGGAEFTLPEGLQANQAYTISVPAGILTSNLGNTPAATFTVHTPVVLDGTYFLKNEDGQYLSRGLDWGTRAMADQWGLPVEVSTSTYGLSTIKFPDCGFYLFKGNDENTMWCDNNNAAAREINWIFTAKTGGVTISYVDAADKFICQREDDARLHYNGTADEATVWTLEAPATHVAKMEALRTEATSLSSKITGLKSEVIVESSMTKTAEQFQGSDNIMKNTISVNPGIYKLTIPAFHRMTTNAKTQALHAIGADCPPVYMYFGDAKVQLRSVYDYAPTGDVGTDNVYDGKNYPNGPLGALTAFKEGGYANTLWIEVEEIANLEYGIQNIGKVNSANQNNQWTCYASDGIEIVRYYSQEQALTDGTDVTSLLTNADLEANHDGNRPTGWNGNTSSWRWTKNDEVTEGEGEEAVTTITNTFMECWNGAAADVNFNMYQTINNLTEGVYELSADMFYSSNGADLAPMFTGGECGLYASTPSSNAFVGVTEDKDGMSRYTLYIYVKKGESLTVGVKNVAKPTGRWFGCDNFTLTYRTPAGAKADLLATVPASQANATLKSAMNTAKNKFQLIANADNFTSLVNAIYDVNVSAANYGHLKYALGQTDDRKENTSETAQAEYDKLMAEYQQYYDDQTATGDCEGEIRIIKAALAQALINTKSSLTPLIRNNSFEMGDLTGWKVNAGNDTGVKANSGATYGTDGGDGTYLFNTWSPGDLGGNPLTQNIGYLPAGTYKMSALLASSTGTVYLTFNNYNSTGTVTTDKTIFLKGKMTVNLTDPYTEVTIGVAGGDADGMLTGTSYSWYKADNFQLEVASNTNINDEDDEETDITTNPYFARGSEDIFGRFTLTGISGTPKEQGLCYSTTNKKPTVSDSKSTSYLNYNGKIYHISGLTPSTAYYVRPYAMMNNGTVYYGKAYKVYTIRRGNMTYNIREMSEEDHALYYDRINNAVAECVDYWNKYSSLTNFNLNVGYAYGAGAGGGTAECSYGGWMSISQNTANQRTGTVMHEGMHGIGIGTSDNYRTLCSGKNWTGPRTNELIKFLENNEAAVFYGDGSHAWCTTSAIDYCINGSDKDKGGDQYIFNSLLVQSFGEDGLKATTGSTYFAPYYSIQQEDEDMFCIVNAKNGKYLVDGNGSLRAMSYGNVNEAMSANATWNLIYDPVTGYYNIKSTKGGRYLSHENYAWGMNKADHKIALVKSVNAGKFWLNTPTPDGRNLLGSLACGNTNLIDYDDANGQDWIITRVSKIKGDVNNDGVVDMDDVDALRKYLVKKDLNAVYPDVNEDGRESIGDMPALIQILKK